MLALAKPTQNNLTILKETKKKKKKALFIGRYSNVRPPYMVGYVTRTPPQILISAVPNI